MNNRPNPETFAFYSYRLAYVSSGIILLAVITSFIPGPITAVLANVIWLALVSGIAGTFMGFAANSDFKRVRGSAEAVHMARVGFRMNLISTIVVGIFALLVILVPILASQPVQVQP